MASDNEAPMLVLHASLHTGRSSADVMALMGHDVTVEIHRHAWQVVWQDAVVHGQTLHGDGHKCVWQVVRQNFLQKPIKARAMNGPQ